MQEKVNTIMDELRQEFIARDDVIKGLMTCMLARKHAVLLGPPGTAKSQIIRAITGRIEGAQYFERLMTKFTVPEEIFGPISLASLEKDEYRRITDKKLPTAHIVLLDEIFKASSAILNTLLSAINERVFHNNGSTETCPLISLIGASNELPSEGELAALYDRFLMRYTVDYVSSASDFKRMLQSGVNNNKKTTITLDELAQIHNEVEAVEVDENVLSAMAELRMEINRDFSTSDRRWKESISLLQATAWISGKTTVSPEDLVVLADSLWDDPDDKPKILAYINKVIYPNRVKVLEIFDAAYDVYSQFTKENKDNRSMETGLEASKKLQHAKKSLAKLDVNDDTEFRDGKIKELSKMIGEINKILLGDDLEM